LSDSAAVVATLLAAVGLVAWQHETTAALRAELTGRVNPSAEIQSLQRTNLQLAKRIAEAEDLHRTVAETPAPRAAAVIAAAPRSAPPVNLVVTAQGTLRWNEEPVTLEEFTQRLAALPRQHPGQEPQVLVHGNPGAGFGAVSYAVEQTSRAGIRSIAVDSQATPDPTDNWITPAAKVPGPNDVPPPTIPDPKAHP
jgi:biopolymer transport protein ExbD